MRQLITAAFAMTLLFSGSAFSAAPTYSYQGTIVDDISGTGPRCPFDQDMNKQERKVTKEKKMSFQEFQGLRDQDLYSVCTDEYLNGSNIVKVDVYKINSRN